MTYKFRVPIIPPSSNKMYSINHYNRSVYLTPEARHFKMCVKLACPTMKFSSEKPRLSIEIAYYSPKWICKNGRYRKKDIQNCDKLIFDAISERLGVDDSHIFKYSGEKIVDIDEFTEIVINEILQPDELTL